VDCGRGVAGNGAAEGDAWGVVREGGACGAAAAGPAFGGAGSAGAGLAGAGLAEAAATGAEIASDNTTASKAAARAKSRVIRNQLCDAFLRRASAPELKGG
jgi:hypothetical protein